MVELSKRLEAVASMVSMGNRVCDVGCDHGYVSIYLVERGISPKVIAMDVRSGPLSQANAHILQYHLTEYIETRLSDGVDKLQSGEADTLILAGMGGRLMESILEKGMDKVSSLKELILQPQSEISLFREYLAQKGFEVADENMVYEDGKFYPMMRVIPKSGTADAGSSGGNTSIPMNLRYRYGGLLLDGKHPVLKKYLLMEKEKLSSIGEELSGQKELSEKVAARLKQIRDELAMNEQALSYYRN